MSLPYTEVIGEREPLLSHSDDIASNTGTSETTDVEEVDQLTPEETSSLRRVPDRVSLGAYCVILTELFERAALVGACAPFQNYLANPLPRDGNGAGAPGRGSLFPAGALGLRQSSATALVMGFELMSYMTPIGGALFADLKWGRHQTIINACPICLLGLAIITASSIPSSIERSLALPGWIMGAAIYAIGLGGIKPNLAPLVADQGKQHKPFVKMLPSGERVIVDPTLTISKLYNTYFWLINFGSFSALAVTAVERYIGFWLAFLIPTVIFLMVPLTLIVSREHCIRHPSEGSVLLNAYRCISLAIRRDRTKKGDGYMVTDSWSPARPSYYDRLSSQRSLSAAEIKLVSRITWTDSFVEEIRQTLRACQIFLFFPVYWLAYGQMLTNLISQSATMDHRDIPNDLLRHFEAIALTVLTPLLNFVIYPSLIRHKMNPGPMLRIYIGFMLVTAAMAYASILQYQIYLKSPCQKYASGCNLGPAPISVWAQLPAYLLIAMSQILVTITGMEYGYNQSQKGMKSIVMCLFTITIAGGDLLNVIMSPFAHDPLLFNFYSVVTCFTFVTGTIFYFLFKGRDKKSLS